MPNIAEYTATGEITPSDKGIQAAEIAGRRLGQFGNEINQSLKNIGDKIDEHMAVMETSELYKTGTELRLNLQQKYDQESALPENRNDPHFGDRFMAEVGPQLDKWGSGARTQHGQMLAATLKAQIRNETFNHVVAGQSVMDAAHVHDNMIQVGNMLGAGLSIDPSEANLRRSLGTMKDAIQGSTMAIPDVETRERVASQLGAEFFPQLVGKRYREAAEAARVQISQTGDPTQSPAYSQLEKDIASQVGFEHLSPEQQAVLPGWRDEAKIHGLEEYKSRINNAKEETIAQGKGVYAQIHNAYAERQAAGLPPTPEMTKAAHDYAQKYGATNPGEAASLDEMLVKSVDRGQENKVQPYDQKVRDNIQGGFALPPGSPGRPTLASIGKAYGLGQITEQDFRDYSEIAQKLDKPSEDPKFKAAFEALKRWQTRQVQAIGMGQKLPGVPIAQNQFIHDSTASFMGQGRGNGDWDKALNNVTDANSPASFAHMLWPYQQAARRPDPAQWFKQHWYEIGPDGKPTTPVRGSTTNPVYPTATNPLHPAYPNRVPLTPGQTAPKPADDLKKADEIIWGKR